MPIDWINPKIIVGNIASGTFYFPRPNIERSIWEEIEKGNHVLIAAPRRVGKSSVMQAMCNQHPEHTRCIFENIQGIKSEAEYYQRFYELLLRCLNRFEKGRTWINSLIKGIVIEEIGPSGVKFGDKKEIQFDEAIKDLLLEISKHELQVVLLLDELPEVLNNLHRNKRTEEAANILNHLRELRQNQGVRGHLSLVLAGSVGIQHVVKAVEGRIKDINDFNPVPFDPMSLKEAKAYITWATKDATVQYDEKLSDYLLGQIKHFIPYFINLMLDEINLSARKSEQPDITTRHIDNAFGAILKTSDHFKDWKYRLNDYFTPEEAAFLHEILIFIAHNDSLNTRRLYDFAVKHKLHTNYMELVRGLEHDGYIYQQGDRYLFISPFLQTYWKLDNPIYPHE